MTKVFLYLSVQAQSLNTISSGTRSFESERKQATTVAGQCVALAFLLAVQLHMQIFKAATNTPRNSRKMLTQVLDRRQ